MLCKKDLHIPEFSSSEDKTFGEDEDCNCRPGVVTKSVPRRKLYSRLNASHATLDFKHLYFLEESQPNIVDI